LIGHGFLLKHFEILAKFKKAGKSVRAVADPGAEAQKLMLARVMGFHHDKLAGFAKISAVHLPTLSGPSP
jgi:hypothetical protein